MKKSLIALAALAVVSAASAQSTVTLSGNLDVSYGSIGGTTPAANKGQTVSSQIGSSTSAINIEAVEDLGGGMKAGARVELDPRNLMVDGGAFATSQSYVMIQTGFGTVKAGRPNTPSYDAFAAASALGTATGSGYTYTNGNVTMATRFNRSVKYESPTFSGLTASVVFAPGNDSPAASTAVYGGLPYQRKTTDIGLKYVNGPLNIALANISASSQTNAATVAPTGTAKTSMTTIGASYVLGAFTGYAGYNTGDTLGYAGSIANPVAARAIAENLKTSGFRLGAKYVIGNTTLLASTAKQDIDFTTGVTTAVKVSGIRAEQALSKRTAVYVAYENYNTGFAAGTVAATTVTGATGKINTTAVGIRHSF